MKRYKNPIPRLGGKRFELRMIFDFQDWTETNEALDSIRRFIQEEGIPIRCISDITPTSAYKEDK